HWSNAMCVMFAGCGVPGGTVVGATDDRGYAAVERILSPENFASTVYRKLGIDPDKVYYTPQGRPAHLVSDATPIHELMYAAPSLATRATAGAAGADTIDLFVLVVCTPLVRSMAGSLAVRSEPCDTGC